MFKRIKLRIRDMKTISQLISGSEKQANNLGEEEAGAEHFVLSALELPDGSAKRVFDRLGVGADEFKTAIKKQYSDALNSVGVSAELIEENPEPIETGKVFHHSKPSGQNVMKLLYELKKTDKERPLLGAHVMSVVSTMEHGVVARAIKTLGIDRDQLSQAVRDELALID